jgi:nitrogen fixation/metabolism regulation signal transduction histidine kinase
MKYIILISVIVGVGLLYLLSSNNSNTHLFSANYYTLLVLAGSLAAALAGLVAYQFWRLRRKVKQRVFGARLSVRLTLFFIGIAVLPGILVYAVSVDFLGKSIESWFDVRVEKALEGGLNLGKNSLDNSLNLLVKKTRFIALLLAEKAPEKYPDDLRHLIAEGDYQSASIYNKAGESLAFAGSQSRPKPPPPDAEMLKKTLAQGEASNMESGAELTLHAMALVRNKSTGLQYIVHFTQLVPAKIQADAETVQAVYADYQALVLSRLGLKRLYGITLSLSLLVVLLTAVSAAFFISEKIGESLESLAAGTRAVAQGDFSAQYPVRSGDELGTLTTLFNQMTRQLADARRASETQQRQVEKTNGYLESVLTHLSSGVIGLDELFRVRSANTSAAQILDIPLAQMQHSTTQEIAEKHPLLNSFCQAVQSSFTQVSNVEWQLQLERLTKQGNQILLLRGTQLPKEAGGGYVLVFDDISHLLQAERQAAWGEVARRLAHEIKNPLTPIQLFAERLQHKLGPSLVGADAQLLQRATQTIVSQVAAMKNMVSDFANYARGPAIQLVPLDFHQLIKEIASLYETHGHDLHLELQATQKWINGDATRLRQVLHNLLKNAQDALQDRALPFITLSTRFVAGQIVLQVKDNGLGFAPQVLARAFEPYMTTKSKGTGLGLAIVKKIVEEHGGQINIENEQTGGACVTVSLPSMTEA